MVLDKLFFPFLKKSDLLKKSEEDFKFFTDKNADYICLDEFYEFFGFFSIIWINSSNLSSTLAFLQMIYERITKIVYTHIENNQIHNVDYTIEITFHSDKSFLEGKLDGNLVKLYKILKFYLKNKI